MNFADIFGIKKTRVPELSCGFVCVIPCLAVLVEHRLVTDRHRRTQGHSIYHASIVSRSKKEQIDCHSVKRFYLMATKCILIIRHEERTLNLAVNLIVTYLHVTL